MAGTRLLLLESASSFARPLIEFLERFEPSWQIEWTHDADEATSLLLEHHHDGALIDWNLPGNGGGLAVCRSLRQAGSPTALVLLSAREAVEDRVLAARVGADDLITRQVDPAELHARVHAALVRASIRRNAAESTVLSWGPLQVCLLQQQVLLNGAAIDLTRHQLLLLVRMMQLPGEPVPPLELCQFAGIQADSAHQNLRTEMRRLRQRLGDAGAFVRAFRGFGYCLTTDDDQRVGNDT